MYADLPKEPQLRLTFIIYNHLLVFCFKRFLEMFCYKVGFGTTALKVLYEKKLN